MDCGESGSTLRFLIPLFSLSAEEAVFTGHGKLMERPQNVYEEIYAEQGLLFQKTNEELHVKGPLQSGTYALQGKCALSDQRFHVCTAAVNRGQCD